MTYLSPPHVSAVPRLLGAALAASLIASTARAQGSPWFGEDALVLSRGMARLGLAPTWTRFDQRYRADGEAEPLAADLSTDTLGVSRLSILAPLQQQLPSLTGLPDVRVSLGRTRVDHDVSIFSVPLSAEMGIGGRLSLGLVVPIVRTRSAVLFSPNPAVGEGNVGINPALDSEDARAQNAALFAQFASAIDALEALIAACADPGNPDPRCPQARTPEAQELASGAAVFAGGLGDVYSETASPFVPLANSTLDAAIRARITSFAQSFADYAITDITSSGPMGATIAGYADMLRILTDSTFGLRAQPLATRTTTSIGDIEVGAKLQLVNTVRRDTLQRYGAGVRAAVGAVFRFGTGRADDPDDFVDIPSGDGQNDVEVRTYWDFLLGSRFAVGVVGRYVLQLPDREIVRITEPHQLFAAYWRRQEVERDLGDIIDAQITPRIAFGDFFSVMAQYRVRRKAEDRHTGRFNVTDELGEPVVLDASILDLETEQREDRVSIGLGYSTLASVARRRARIPIEIFMQYGESIRGSGGKTPKLSVGVMHVRVYVF
jgi:hypothetical protein